MKQCLWCQKETVNPKFCSLSCGARHQQSLIPKYSRINYCLQCEKPFKYVDGKKFCTRSCSATYNNKIRERSSKTKELRINELRIKSFNSIDKKSCVCGKEIRKNSTYCVQCSGKYKHESKVQSWIDGTWDATNPQGLAIPIKKYLIKKANFKCSKCGWDRVNPITNRCPLEVNHIDGNAYNNKAENLEVICPNCHSLTPNYRALNKNSRRSYRRIKQKVE